MKTEKVLLESEYEKYIQVTSDNMTYTLHYKKEFSKCYKDGFRWYLV